MYFLKKILFVISLCFLMSLNNCVQTTATLFGPAFTAAKTGSLYQAGLSYSSNNILKKHLGKDPSTYVRDLFVQSFNQNKPTNTVKVKYQTISTHYTLISENDEDDYVEIFENDEDDYTEFMMAVKKTLK